jgi:electron transport complex protein RnfG
MKHIIKPAFALFIITAIATALLGIARNYTLEPTEKQRKKTQENMMKEVLPGASLYREISSEKIGTSELKLIDRIYEGVKDNEVTGYVVELSPVGYGGTINMLVGISGIEEKITGMRVLKHTETPGLGALAVKEKFFTKFNGKELFPLTVVKIPTGKSDEIEAITASTITTRAITDAVNEAIQWYKEGSK